MPVACPVIRFSGELEGEAVSSQEKAQLVRQYAAEQGVDLQECHAYGDSIADLAMLESVSDAPFTRAFPSCTGFFSGWCSSLYQGARPNAK